MVTKTYMIEDLIRDCETPPTNVVVLKEALDTSWPDFGLLAQIDVVEFIANGGLVDKKFIHSEEYGQSMLTPKPMVDDYTFMSGKKMGYFAFL